MQRQQMQEPGSRFAPKNMVLACSLLLVLSSACSPLPPAPIAVQGAVDSELGPLLEAIGRPAPRIIRGFSFWEGEIAGHSVVISRTEVGMVHAAMATTLLIEEYAPRLIINQGTAGAVNPELAVGDIVLGRESVPFGAFRTAHRDPGEGVDLSTWATNPRKLRKGGARIEFERFDANADLLASALAVPYAAGRLVEGVVGSADQWNREIDKLLWARETWGVDSEDMESAAVAQVAEIMSVPFLAIRIISNSEHTNPEFHEETGADCARYVVAVVESVAGP